MTRTWFVFNMPWRDQSWTPSRIPRAAPSGNQKLKCPRYLFGARGREQYPSQAWVPKQNVIFDRGDICYIGTDVIEFSHFMVELSQKNNLSLWAASPVVFGSPWKVWPKQKFNFLEKFTTNFNFWLTSKLKRIAFNLHPLRSSFPKN